MTKRSGFQVEFEAMAKPLVRQLAADVEKSLVDALMLTTREFFKREGRPQSASAVAGPATIPTGFNRVGCVEGAPWFALQKGNVLEGRLLGKYDREDRRSKTGKSSFFQVDLLASTTVRVGRGSEASFEQAQPGQVVNVNMGPKTMVLSDYCEAVARGGSILLILRVGDKIELPNGNSIWDIQVATKEEEEGKS